MTTGALIIGPSDVHQPDSPEADLTLLWSAYPPQGSDDSVVSLPLIIEERQQLLRSTYLSWMRSIPNATAKGGTIEERLRIRPDLSYWWLSLPGDFPFSEDSPILPTIKLLALDMVCQERGVTRLSVTAGSAPVREALRRWGSNTGREIAFAGAAPVWTNDALVALHAAGTAAKYLFTRAFRRGSDAGLEPSPAPEGLALIDYLGQQEAESLSMGHFRSRYWGPLVDLLPRPGEILWMHRRVSGTPWPQTPVPEQSAGEGTHIDITDLASPRSRLRGLRDYARVARRSFALNKVPALFVVPDTGVDTWPLVRTTWMQAFLGAHAMHNLMWLASIETRLSEIPRQRLGVYLMENQPWEIALLSAWRRAGNGRLVGFAHTTVRFWDLRYALTGQALANHSRLCPVADRIAVNGPAARAEMVGFGVPEVLLADVEAVRFMGSAVTLAANLVDDAAPVRVLVLGEYWPAAAESQVRLLEQLDTSTMSGTDITFRPHPASRPKAGNCGSVRISPADSALADDLVRCDAVLVGETSSVAIEALAADRPLALIADPSVLPTSPLRAAGSIPVLRTSGDISEWISKVGAQRSAPRTPPSVHEYFNLDEKLALWSELLPGPCEDPD